MKDGIVKWRSDLEKKKGIGFSCEKRFKDGI